MFAAFRLLLLTMQPERQQTLRINVNAKAKTFHFKFKAITILPTTSKLFPFPFPIKLDLKLKLCPSLLQSKKSEHHFPIPRRGNSWKSKFLRILGKVRPRTSKNKATPFYQTSNMGHPDAHFSYTQLRHFPYEVGTFHGNFPKHNYASFYNLGALVSLLSCNLLLQGII